METLRLVHRAPSPQVLTTSTVALFGAVAESAGVKVEVDPGDDRKAGPLGQNDRVVQGAVDIAWGGPGRTPAQFPRAMGAALPGAVPEGMAGEDLRWNAHYAGLLNAKFRATKPRAL